MRSILANLSMEHGKNDWNVADGGSIKKELVVDIRRRDGSECSFGSDSKEIFEPEFAKWKLYAFFAEILSAETTVVGIGNASTRGKYRHIVVASLSLYGQTWHLFQQQRRSVYHPMTQAAGAATVSFQTLARGHPNCEPLCPSKWTRSFADGDRKGSASCRCACVLRGTGSRLLMLFVERPSHII